MLSIVRVIVTQHAIALRADDVFGEDRNFSKIPGVANQPFGIEANFREQIAIVRHLDGGETYRVDQPIPGTKPALTESHGHIGGQISFPGAHRPSFEPLGDWKNGTRPDKTAYSIVKSTMHYQLNGHSPATLQ